jgi:hypothetical protein
VAEIGGDFLCAESSKKQFYVVPQGRSSALSFAMSCSIDSGRHPNLAMA